jgi:copper chaperone CopZ
MAESQGSIQEAESSGQDTSREITLRIDGMHCGSCIRRVTQAIAQAGPFQVKEVRLGAARFAGPAGSEAMAVGALAKAGFAARVDE